MPCEHGTDSNEVCLSCAPRTSVTLSYFRRSGKYYASGSFISSKGSFYEIITEVGERVVAKNLPGLTKSSASEFIVLAEVDENRSFNIAAGRWIFT